MRHLLVEDVCCFCDSKGRTHLSEHVSLWFAITGLLVYVLKDGMNK